MNKNIKTAIKLISITIITILLLCLILKYFFPAEWSFITPHKQGDFVRVGNMHKGLHSPKAILLNDGKVVIFTSKYFEIYNPKTRRFKLYENNLQLNYFFLPIKLKDGQVLLIGGESKDAVSQNTTFIFNPDTYVFSKGPNMSFARTQLSATLLDDGRVFVVGGINKGDKTNYLESTELYNPKTNNFEKGPDLPEALSDTKISKLKGNIYIYGGEARYYKGISDPYNVHIFAYNDSTRKIYKIAKLIANGHNLQSFTVENYKVLIFNGNNPYVAKQHCIVQEFDSKSNKVICLNELNMSVQRVNGAVLPDGNIIFPGGFSGYATGYKTYNTAAIYNLKKNKFVTLNAKLGIKRDGYNTNILLEDNNVLVIGGNNKNLQYAEIYMFNNKIER